MGKSAYRGSRLSPRSGGRPLHPAERHGASPSHSLCEWFRFLPLAGSRTGITAAMPSLGNFEPPYRLLKVYRQFSQARCPLWAACSEDESVSLDTELI
jgi:hypothetical protein